jgi:flagellar protein FliO/FliZ
MGIETQLAKAATVTQPDFFSTAVRTFSTLCILLAVILVGSYLIRRFWPKSAGFMSGDQWVRVIATSYLAPKKTISVVEVAGEILVLGLTENQISMLARVTNQATIDDLKESQRQRESAGIFRNPLKSMLSGRKDGTGQSNALFTQISGIPTDAVKKNRNC